MVSALHGGQERSGNRKEVYLGVFTQEHSFVALGVCANAALLVSGHHAFTPLPSRL